MYVTYSLSLFFINISFKNKTLYLFELFFKLIDRYIYVRHKWAFDQTKNNLLTKKIFVYRRLASLTRPKIIIIISLKL